MKIKKTAFVFPGQGSQYIGLLSSFKEHQPQIQSVFKAASQHLGYDVWELAQKGPITRLNQTAYTQPVLLTASVALFNLWKSQEGRMPDFLAGHSLGEYTAYTCGGALTFEKAVQIVAKRGEYMQSAVLETKGAMGVIVGLDHVHVVHLCEKEKQNEVVGPSSYNTLDQTVISGHYHAVVRVMERAKKEKARLVRLLPISVPAHCDLMQPAVQSLSVALEQFRLEVPCIPVVSNTHIVPLNDVKSIQASLLSQLCQPVDWVGIIHYLLSQEVNCFIECGPNQILTHLIRHIVKNKATVISLGEYDDFQRALTTYV